MHAQRAFTASPEFSDLVTSTGPVTAELAQMLLACNTCRGWAEQEEGPYRREAVEFRRDLIEDRDGVPLQLGIRLVGGDGRPATGAEVEIWHCDALGRYSGFPPPDSSVAVTSQDAPRGEYLPEQTWLRGRHPTDDAGMVEFRTIFPGWYPGRTVHIHITVSAEEATLTSQLYFPEQITVEVLAMAPYHKHPDRDTTNTTDEIFPMGGVPAVLDVVSAGDGYRAGACLALPGEPATS